MLLNFAVGALSGHMCIWLLDFNMKSEGPNRMVLLGKTGTHVRAFYITLRAHPGFILTTRKMTVCDIRGVFSNGRIVAYSAIDVTHRVPIHHRILLQQTKFIWK